MHIEDLMRDESLRQAEFPVCRNRIFLAHAAVCAMPHRVAKAVADCTVAGTVDDQEASLGQLLYGTREIAAKTLDASIREIALVGPTSLALSYVAGGIEFQAGENVICYFDDYPSNVYPWLALREKGVEVRFIKTGALGMIQPDDVLSLVDDRTRLVALPSCHFISGWRLDVDTIGKALREKGVLFCLDAIQTVGAFPTSVEHVDFLAADAHKWMLGPCSAGLLYVRQEVQDQLKPMVFGWHNVECRDFVSADHIELKKDARRYEAGTHNIAGTAGLKAALELLHEVGIEQIATKLLRQRKRLTEELTERGWTVLQADSSEQNQGGMFSITKGNSDPECIHRALAERNTTVSLRVDRTGRQYLRLSPHFYNSDAELDRFLSQLDEVQ